MTKKVLFAILIGIIVLCLCSCDDMKVVDNAVEAPEDNGNPSETISTDFAESLVRTMVPDTNIRISGIKDSELLVIRAKDNDKSIGRSMSSGLISSRVGNWIIVGDIEGVCEFNSSQVINGKTEVTISRIPIVKVDHTNNKDIRTIKVLDHNGEAAGRFPIAGTKYGYFIDEKVLYVDLKDLRENSVDTTDFSKCVIARKSQYADNNRKPETIPDDGVHNTRETYGVIMFNAYGNPIIENNGVQDFSGLDSIKLYAGFASNALMGSGMSIMILPVKVLSKDSPLTIPSSEMDSVFGLEDLEEGCYAIEVSDYDGMRVDRTAFANYTSEINEYDGKHLRTGFVLDNEWGSDSSFKYYLGKLSGNIYVDNHILDDSNYNGYAVRLVESPDTTAFAVEKSGDSIVIEVNSTDEAQSTEGGVKVYKRYDSIDGSNRRSGRISRVLTGFDTDEVSYNVKLQYFDGDSWKDYENDHVVSCRINYASTGNNLLNHTVYTERTSDYLPDGEDRCLIIQMQYVQIDKPVRAVISFE